MSTWMLAWAFSWGLVFGGQGDSSGYKYKDAERGFSITLPKGWEVGKSSGKDTFVAIEDFENPEDTFRENLNLITTDLDQEVDLQTLYNLNVDNAEKMLKEFKAWEVDKTSLSEIPAMRLIYSFAYGDATLKNMVYIAVHDGKMYTLTLATEEKAFDEHKKEFEEIARSLQLQSMAKEPSGSSNLENTIEEKVAPIR